MTSNAIQAENSVLETQDKQVFFINCQFSQDFLQKNGNPPAVFLELQALGDITVVPHTAAIPVLEEYQAQQLYMHWTVKLKTHRHIADIEAILIPYIADEENTITLEQVTLPPPEPASQAAADSASGMLKSVPAKPADTAAPAAFLISASDTLVRAGANLFLVPAACVVEVLFQLEALQDEKLTYQDSQIPVLPVRELFHLYSNAPSGNAGVVVKYEQRSVCLAVDEVFTQSRAILYPVNEDFSRLPGIAGAVILDNEEVAFALDIPDLLPNP